MNSIKLLVDYSDNTKFEDPVSNFWLTLTQEQNGNYLLEIMLIKDLEDESDTPKAFNHKNHPAKYKLNLKNTGNGSFLCTRQKGIINKQILSLALRCIVTAWENWNDQNFTGVDFGAEVENERKSWFPSDQKNIPSGDMELVLKTTRVKKVI
jgi:hypothetical protein